ncbi:hypothetical protein GKD33_19885 [Parabacteroides merdae]|uniref:Uncharacterized protein n=2 Tax=Bacteroidales TaxID=171549 RepID=A0A9Q4WTG1_9BACT|nr:hypothetical protein [Parabacteroides merdae]MDB8919032.1 hypothetical protein [Parabacteroides merdae]MDB8927182.1 hypothetical protein [Parabacteroides merdae]MRX89782.1 hypothetical protein [Parabacteroides merdae]MTT44353.1 hypothetical protein [Parabacteroides merdae]MTT60153.1 hypothetical protein [Parabacteroides merdae]
MERMIPSVNVGMSEMGLMELFGVIAPTLRAIITVIYEHERLCLATTRHDDVVTSVNWATFFLLQLSTSCIPKRL